MSPLRQDLENGPSNEDFFGESIECLRQWHAHTKTLKNAEHARRRSISPLPSLLRTTPLGYRSLSQPQVALLREVSTQNLVTQNVFYTPPPSQNPVQTPSSSQESPSI